MRKSWNRYLIFAVLFSISGLAQNAQKNENPEAFIRRVYADYQNPDWQHEADRQNSFYTSQLNALIEQDRKRDPGGICHLDWDPICNCQDPGNPGELKLDSMQVAQTTASTASVLVKFTIATSEHSATLMLKRTAPGWRIDDIRTPQNPSLRKLLRRPC